MKAVILSAGQGSRLLPLTAELPKCLLPLDDLTLIEWQANHHAHVIATDATGPSDAIDTPGTMR